MANTYSSLFYHIVFSTRNRHRWIVPDIEKRIWAYIGGIARKQGVTALRIGGIEDHIHALFLAPPKLSPARIVQPVKGESSKWIRQTFPDLGSFAWQDGYSAFSVSRSAVPRVIGYIKHQRRHHTARSFEEEYIGMLELNDVDVVDEKYIFG